MKSFKVFSIDHAVWAVCAVVISVGVEVGLAAELPTFTNRKDKTSIEIQEYKSTIELIYAGKKPDNEYSIEFESLIQVPKTLDLVCVTDQVDLTAAEGAKRQSLMMPRTLRKTSTRTKSDDFNAFHGGVAKTELKSAEVNGNPYTIKELTVTGSAVLAKKRAEVIIDATVEEDFKSIGHSMKLRISSMKIDRSRVCEISLDYHRPKGKSGAFLEAVYALDAKGNVLGGGRWSKGMGIFSDSMQFKGEFVIARGANIDKFKCIILTDYEVRPVEYIITDIFQQ